MDGNAEMTHDELLAKIDGFSCCSGAHELALRAVVELPENDYSARQVQMGYNQALADMREAIKKELG